MHCFCICSQIMVDVVSCLIVEVIVMDAITCLIPSVYAVMIENLIQKTKCWEEEHAAHFIYDGVRIL
jgi:hypothetical protein